MKEGLRLNIVLVFIAGVGIGGTVGMIAMSLVAVSKVEPPPLARDIKITVNLQKIKEILKDDEK
ncbi:MAG: hypothetical protein K2K06_00400 [Oscillospiraceae bacterium]|nr:hypothetical protein [Oscillospiraceae bacterium]